MLETLTLAVQRSHSHTPLTDTYRGTSRLLGFRRFGLTQPRRSVCRHSGRWIRNLQMQKLDRRSSPKCDVACNSHASPAVAKFKRHPSPLLYIATKETKRQFACPCQLCFAERMAGCSSLCKVLVGTGGHLRELRELYSRAALLHRGHRSSGALWRALRKEVRKTKLLEQAIVASLSHICTSKSEEA